MSADEGETKGGTVAQEAIPAQDFVEEAEREADGPEPAAFEGRERTAVKRRRGLFGIPEGAPLVGIALSGGGIRSATFSLGFLQALSARGLLRRVDYLSTVSGGSYIGSFFCALFVPPQKRGGRATVERPRFDPNAPLQSPLGVEAVRRLRDAGRYLTPSGTSDAFFGAAVVMRNWVAVQLVIGFTILLGFWALRALDGFVVSDALGGWDGPISPSVALLALLAAAFVAAAGSAYWLTRRDWIPGPRWQRVALNLVFWAVLLLLAYATSPWWAPARWSWAIPSPSPGAAYGALVVGLTLTFFLAAELRHGAVDYTNPDDAEQRRKDINNPQLLMSAEDRVRSKLSRLMSMSLTWLLIFLVILAIDALASLVPASLARMVRPVRSLGDLWVLVSGSWPAIVSFATPILSWVAHRRLKKQEAEARARAEGARAGSWVPAMLVIAGSALVLFWLLMWSALSHYAFGALQERGQLALLILLVSLNLVLSFSFSFINLSSLSTFYAARLRRAYIGASSYGTAITSLRRDDPQDTIGLDAYYTAGPAAGAPAHIINVTIAETVAGHSSIVARDRKGKPMQVTPGGIAHEAERPGSLAVHHRRWGEELPLANWVAISGAAVSAAIGSGTSLGTSILATMTNLRLGYWWRSDRKRGRLFWSNPRDSVQNHLLLELRGAFHGSRRRRWYLTDGGHFENSGAYALLQRRVRYIIICDNGADPEYAMGDIVRLIGRARTDLGARISFLAADKIVELLGPDSPVAQVIGSYVDLARRGSHETPGGPIAAIATIDYGEAEPGLLLLVKPRLTYDEPPELLAYRAQPGCGDFPQQTTGDQFFDELQWEAYRRLGELAGEKLFVAGKEDREGWLPVDLFEAGAGSGPVGS